MVDWWVEWGRYVHLWGSWFTLAVFGSVIVAGLERSRTQRGHAWARALKVALSVAAAAIVISPVVQVMLGELAFFPTLLAAVLAFAPGVPLGLAAARAGMAGGAERETEGENDRAGQRHRPS